MRLNISALLSFLSFMFIILFLLITLRVPSSNGYEFSIYDRYPWYFWVLIFLSYVTGYMAIIKESIHINHNTNKYWIFGFIAILLVDLYLLFLPTLVRGYVVYGRGDVLSHIGYVKDILSYNFLMTYNIYPIEHVSVAILCLISNLRVESIVRIYPQILSFLNILFLIALIKLIFGNKREFLLAFVCASILFYGNSYFFFAPTWQAFYILPLIIFIFYKLITSKKLILEFIIISLLVSFIYDLYHPINTIFLIIIICSLICIYCWLHLANLRFSTDILKHFILINSITIWTWYISFPRIDQSLKEMFFGIRTSTFQQYATLISYSNPRIQDLITVIIYRYGCYISVSLLTSILLVYMYTKNKKLNLKFYEIYFLLNYIDNLIR